MAIAPAIGAAVSVVGAVSGAVQQSNANAAARRQAATQATLAKQKYNLERQRFTYRQNAAEQQFLVESMTVQEQSRQAMESLRQAEIVERMRRQEADVQNQRVTADVQNQVAQLLMAAAATEAESSIQNTNLMSELSSQLNETLGSRFNLARARGVSRSSIQDNALDNADILAYQNTLNAANTNDRVAGFESSSLRQQAQAAGRFGEIAKSYLTKSEAIQRQMNDYMLTIQPKLLQLQDERNTSMLAANRAANAAETTLGRTSSLFNLQNNLAAVDAMRPTGSNGFVTLLNGLSQAVPYVASNWDAISGAFGGQTSAPSSYGYNTGEMYGPLPPAPAPVPNRQLPYAPVPVPSYRRYLA